MRISKSDTKLHLQAEALVESDKPLTLDQRLEVAENWNPMANHNVGWNAAFFTPMDLAREMMIEVPNREKFRVLDLCAGIGRLSLNVWMHHLQGGGLPEDIEIVCIELNPDFIRVGKRVLPEATWIRGDALQESTYNGLGRFDMVISNPPYGLPSSENWLTKAPSQYMVAEAAMRVSNFGLFLLSQGDCPFRYSGQQSFAQVKNSAYESFNRKTGVKFEMNCGIDTSAHRNAWAGTKQITEIVLITKEQREECVELAA